MTRYDLHCHLDFFADPCAAATQLAQRDITCLSATLTPEDYRRTAALLKQSENVRVALGLHPWNVAQGAANEQTLTCFEEAARTTRYIGEVGLDFAARQAGTEQLQRNVFDRVLAACDGGAKLLSIHAVRSASAVLDALEAHGTPQHNTCIFHWFSGTSDELQRAQRLGCYFSVGARMLDTKRGRAYVQALAPERLLLETDLPAKPSTSSQLADHVQVDQMAAALERARAALQDVLGPAIAKRIERTSAELLMG